MISKYPTVVTVAPEGPAEPRNQSLSLKSCIDYAVLRILPNHFETDYTNRRGLQKIPTR
jgi:hypothetical protein